SSASAGRAATRSGPATPTSSARRASRSTAAATAGPSRRCSATARGKNTSTPGPASDRVMWIKLVRHGQSLANVGNLTAQDVGDSNIALTELGHAQAEAAGRELGREFLDDALIYCSPYRRTRQTLD